MWYATERTNRHKHKIVGNILYFPTDFFDDARVKIVSEMPDGDTIVYLWIRLMFLGGKALGMTEDGEYVLTCEDGTVYNEQELCAITNRRPQTVRYALSVLVRFGAYEPLATTQPE